MNAFNLLATLNFLLGGMVFLLGLVILRENPRQKLNRLVAFMLFFGGLGSVLSALRLFGDASGPVPATGWVSGRNIGPEFDYLWEFFFPCLLLFASYFPREREFIRRFRRFDLVIFAPHVFHFLLLLSLTLIVTDGRLASWNLPEILRPFAKVLNLLFSFFLAVHRALFSLVNLFYGLAGALLLLQSHRRARAPRLREQLRVVAGGLTLCLILYAFAYPLPGILGLHLAGWVRALLTISALTVGSGAIALSMVRYKFLDTKLLARRGILYALASGVVVGLYLVVITRINAFLSRVTGTDAKILEPVLLIIGLVLFQPTISRLEEWLERFFLRDPGDYRNVLRRLGRDLLTRIDLDEMLSRSVAALAETLLLRNSSVIALAREGPLVRVGSGPAPDEADVALLDGILHRLSAEQESFRLDDPLEDVDPLDRAILMDRFHAVLVFPLRSQGETVGALFLGEKETGTDFTAEDVMLLSDLARQMSVSLQNGLLLRERVAVARMEEELALARRIQKTFLPSEFPPMERFEVYGVNTPSRQVGGDYFDLVPGADGSFFLAIADVSGKGVPAALLTSMLQASLRTQVETVGSVSAILHGMNNLVHSRTTDEQFATFFLARVDGPSMRLSFSNAGHNYPLLDRRNGEMQELVRGGLVLGMFGEARFEEEAIDLLPGDRIVFYTDGVSEAMNGNGEEFGEERLSRLLRDLPADLGARDTTERVLETLYAFLAGAEPQDDLTIMVLRVLEPARAERGRGTEALAAEAR